MLTSSLPTSLLFFLTLYVLSLSSCIMDSVFFLLFSFSSLRYFSRSRILPTHPSSPHTQPAFSLAPLAHPHRLHGQSLHSHSPPLTPTKPLHSHFPCCPRLWPSPASPPPPIILAMALVQVSGEGCWERRRFPSSRYYRNLRDLYSIPYPLPHPSFPLSFIPLFMPSSPPLAIFSLCHSVLFIL